MTIESLAGETTQQILAAPEKALYIVPNYSMIGYIRDLAMHLGREDITIAVPGYLGTPAIRGPIIIDHAVWQHLQRLPRRDQQQFWQGARRYHARGQIRDCEQLQG